MSRPAGRPKGSPTRKRSQKLLWELENNHRFSVVKELIEIYGYSKSVLLSFVTRIQENVTAGLAPLTGFDENEVSLYNATNRDVLSALLRLLAYCYPKLKALEVSDGTGEKIVFNIHGLPNLVAAPQQDAQEPADTVH